jgi:beta-galactosidase
MRHKLLLTTLVMGCLLSCARCSQAQGSPRIIEDLSRGWLFVRSDVAGAESPDYQEGAEWMPVDLPHTWNTADTFDDEPGYYRGIGWYRKGFGVRDGWKGKRILLRFEAACNVATVWVNGELLGQHKGAWTPFQFDVTDVVKSGGNLMAVKVDNRWRRDVPPHDLDFNIMGGLHREVSLIAIDPLHIVSTRVTTPRVSDTEGVAALDAEVRNEDKVAKEYEVVAEIRGPGLPEPITLTSPKARLQPGETAWVKQQTQPIAKVRLWSPDEPNLYHVSFRLQADGRALDDAESPLGFRWYRFDPNDGFFLNGKHLKLHGVNRHDDYPGIGWAIPQSQQIEDLKQIKHLGANFIRTVHYPQHPVVLDTCDKLGLCVWEEVPFDGEGNHRALVVGAEDFARTLKQNLREEIRRDRNHPSIILWSMGNENTNGPNLDDWKAVANLTRQLVQITKEEDPTRPTTVAINRPDRATESGLADAVDILSYNVYANWNHTEIEQEIDDARRMHPDKPMMIGEYGLDIERGRHAETPKHRDFSEEYACLYHETFWKAIMDRPYLAGSLIWVVCDFGAEQRVRNQTIRHMNQKGLFTFDRQPKDVAQFYRSQWANEPMVYIVSHTWTDRKKGGTPIRVYSNCDAVELFLNGKSLGTRNKDETYLWTAPLAAGSNELRAVARRGEKQVVDTIPIRCE